MTATARITRDDLETKLRQISGDLDDTVESAKPKLLVGALAGVIISVLAYLLGRRRGRKRSALVEIRRI